MRTTLQRPTRRQPLAGFPVVFGLVVVLAGAAVACWSTSETRTDADQPESPGQGRLVDIGGRHLNLECQGIGTPVVVFVAGLGDSGQAAWRTVWGQVARSTRACIYDLRRLLPGELLAPLVHNREGSDLADGLASLTPLDAPGALGHRPLAVMWTASHRRRPLPPARPAPTSHRRDQPGPARGATRRRRQLTQGGAGIMRDRPTGSAGYQDPLISIRGGELVIRRYYFPTGAKRIRLAAISGVQQYAMTKATGVPTSTGAPGGAGQRP
jgi:hypothetical protein